VSKTNRANSEKPWFRKVKDTWYSWKDGRQVSLGVKGEHNRKQALEAFYCLMAGVEQVKPTSQEQKEKPGLRSKVYLHQDKCYNESSKLEEDMTKEELFVALDEYETRKQPATKTTTIYDLVNQFLLAKDGEVCSGTLQGYAKHLAVFAKAYGTRQAESITSDEAEDVSKKAGWSSTYRADFLGTVVCMYRWGVRQRLLNQSPVEGVRKPPRASRGAKCVISEADHNKLMRSADDDFRDYLILLWNTGARPSEIASLTAEQVNASIDGAVPLENHKLAHKGKPRFLILHGEALEVATKRAKEVNSGLIFRGNNGLLTARAIAGRMSRLCERAGTRPINAYSFRHTFATQALVNGLPDAQVSALLGHSDTSMLHKHYSHLTSQTRALKDAIAKVRP